MTETCARHTTPRALIGLLLGGLFLILASASSGSADVVLKGHCDGFPGASSGGAGRLTLSLKDDALRIVNPSQLHVVTIGLSEGHYTEFSAAHKLYEQKSLRRFGELREQREQRRSKKLQAYRQLPSGKDKDAALRALRSEGIEPDGTVVAHSERGELNRVVTIRVNGVPRELRCYRLKIRENKAKKPSFDLWLTPDLKIKEKLLDFYALGTFSEPVLAQLRGIRDFPLEIRALLDSGDFKKAVTCEVKSIENADIPAWHMTIPPRFKRVPSLKKAIDLLDAKAGNGGRCDDCAKTIQDLGRPPSVSWKFPGGARYRFCDKACRKAFISAKKWTKKDQ